MTLFTLNLKTKNKKTNVYWVIQEAERPSEKILVKYFDDKNQVLFQECITGILNGVIDDAIVQKLNQTKKKLIRSIA